MLTKDSLKKRDLIILFLFTALFFIFRLKPINGDSLLAWPITESLIDDSLYHLDDLIIKSGKEGIFYFYKILSWFPFFKANYPLRDFIIYFPIFYLYLLLWFKIFLIISKDKEVSFIALIFFLFSDGKLGLNWSASPMPMLVSLSAVHWIQVLSLYLFIKKFYKTSYFLLAITGYLHPGSSLSYFLVFTTFLAYEALKNRDIRYLASPMIYLISFFPNFYLILKNTQSHSSLPTEYFQIFNLFQYHAYLSDHFREGYIYTISLVLLIIFYWRKIDKKPAYSSEILLIFMSSFLWVILWFLNLYSFKSTAFIHTYYVTRIFYFLKPLIILFFCLTLKDIVNRCNSTHNFIIVGLLLATILLFSPIVSTIIILFFLLSYRSKHLGFIVLLFSIIAFLLTVKSLDNKNLKLLILKNYSFNELILLEVAYFSLIIFSLKNIFPKNESTVIIPNKNRFSIVGLAIFILIFITAERNINIIKRAFNGQSFLQLSWDNYFRQKYDYPEYSMVLDWVRNSNIKGKMFIVPPNEYEFLSFRYFTKNGIYISEYDINQLMYSPKYYFKGFNRLKYLGINIHGRHNFSYEKYGSLSLDYLTKTEADFAIFNKNADGFEKKGGTPVYENNKYVVYKLR